MQSFVKVAVVGEIGEGEMKGVVVNGEEIVLINLGGEYYALSDVCTHAGGSLSLGTLEEDEVECPSHGSRFDVRTGAVRGEPAYEPVQSFAVRVEGNDILVGPR